MSSTETNVWGVAGLAIGILAAGSGNLIHEQWRNQLAAANTAASTTVAQLTPLLADTLRASRYADIPALVDDWGKTDPTLMRIRVQSQNGFVIAEFERPSLQGESLSFSSMISYGYRGRASLTIVSSLSAALARRARFVSELLIANLVLVAAIAAVSALTIANRKAVRRYRTVLATNHALLGGSDTPGLLHAICNAAVTEGGFALAWIALSDDDGFLRPTAMAGPAQDYAQDLRLSADPRTPEGQGPAGIALRENRDIICNDFQKDPRTVQWADRARQSGVRSSAALPLRRDGQVIGLLGLYSLQRGHFDGAESTLVRQMAGDISLGLEHVRRGMEIERNRERLRTILDGLRAFIYLMSVDGTILEINRVPLEVTGFKREDAIGAHLANTHGFAHSRPARDRVRSSLARAALGEIVRYDEVIQILGGGQISIDLTFAPLWGDDGQVVQIVATGWDITRRKRAEEELRHSENKFSILFKESSLPVALSRFPDHRFADVNDAWIRMFGYSKEELLGKTSSDVGISRSVERRMQAIDAIREDPELRSYEQTLHTRAGELLTVLINSNTISISGQPYALTSLQDITARKRTESALQESSERLRGLSRRLMEVEESERRSINRELHDRVGQNLSALNLNLGLIRSGLSADHSNSVNTRLGAAQTLLEATISDIRDLMAELHPPALHDYGLFAALRSYVESLQRTTSMPITITGEDLDPPLQPVVALALFRIAQGALTNAAKHAAADEISVDFSATRNTVRLIIADNGRGFSTTGERVGGPPSWGLNIMRERAEAIGATLQIESQPGAGSRVLVEVLRGSA
jgi:PAS domain S-box-containing protein